MSQETQLTQKKEGDYVCALFEPYRKEKKHLPTLQTYTYDMQTCTCNRRKNCITFRKKRTTELIGRISIVILLILSKLFSWQCYFIPTLAPAEADSHTRT